MGLCRSNALLYHWFDMCERWTGRGDGIETVVVHGSESASTPTGVDREPNFHYHWVGFTLECAMGTLAKTQRLEPILYNSRCRCTLNRSTTVEEMRRACIHLIMNLLSWGKPPHSCFPRGTLTDGAMPANLLIVGPPESSKKASDTGAHRGDLVVA